MDTSKLPETTETNEPTLSPPETLAPEPEAEAPKTETESPPQEAPTPEPTPEPSPSAPEPDVKRCKFSAEGTFDKGIADCKVTKNSKIELDRTQIIVLVQDGKRYTYNRTNIEPIQK